MVDTITDLIPYRYQDEVFRRAKKENIIAAMSTGSGKTLISVLLIKWIASQDNAKGKSVVFLVPKVTLVDQQAETVRERTPLKVVKIFGGTEIDMNDRARWKKKLENQDVFVMTPQIFLNLITHGFWAIQKVSLMIFDECHHARKNHPYNGILREYFQVEPSIRPKVFGMTASPVWNTKNPHVSIAQLESNMNSKVIGIHENIDELEEKAPKPEERIQSYPFAPLSYDCPLTGLFSCLALIDKVVWKQIGIPFYPTLENRYLSTLGNLGPYGASLFLYFEIQHLLSNIQQARYFLDDATECMTTIDSNIDSQESHTEEIRFILDILLDFKSFFPSTGSSCDIPITVDLEWCTPKVKVLVDLLVEFRTKFPTFQCVIFVEQRQVASTLSKVLQVIPELNSTIKTAFLVGKSGSSDGALRAVDQYPGDAVKMFKNGEINVLVATSVAEEGLDFKACDLVIRFDGLHHMVSYVQSRGRARKKASTFVVMVPEGQEDQLAKYLSLKNGENHITHMYRTRNLGIDEDEDDDDLGDEEDTLDLSLRERYVVESTGAILSYDNALHLLGLLCSQIPSDPFTPAHKPRFRGEFQCTLQLPGALPLRPEHLVFHGPLRHTKKEAKRAVAFMAVKRLRELDVFDEYLLPLSGQEFYDDGSSSIGSPSRRRTIPPMMSVLTRDPWCIEHRLWLHHVSIDGTIVTGLVAGTRLPSTEVTTQARRVVIACGEPLLLDPTLEHKQRRLMEDYTRFCIFLTISASPIKQRLGLYLIPFTTDLLPDYLAMEKLVTNPRGISDWSEITESDYGRLIILCLARFGSAHVLHQIRNDLTPLSTPPTGSHESGFSTYHEFWEKKWTTKRYKPTVTTEGPVLDTKRLLRSNVGSYNLDPRKEVKSVTLRPQDRLLPQGNCSWAPLSYTMQDAYKVLSPLCQRITHVCRAHYARLDLGLPAIPDDLLIEALTIPSASFPFNNQRLETLGDAVLQVCTTVHLFHQYPNRHEGQLTKLRHDCVSNRYLLRRALDLGLERFVICENPNITKWRYVCPSEDDPDSDGRFVPARHVEREIPRRCLQDCMEAMLGASFLAGGMNMGLQAGTALGLEFGGSLPWFVRYTKPVGPELLPPLFANLEGRLGYRFRQRSLIREALTHPSCVISLDGEWSPSYQRLEFLGDAILELVVTRYLFAKFPEATSHELSHPRSKAICSPTLAFIAVKRLELHKMMLADSFTLNLSIANSVPVLENISAEKMVKESWKYDPPKALSDVFESVMGAVFIDSGCDYDKTAAVMEHVMEDVLEILSPSIALNPVSELMEWLASQGCTKVHFEKIKKERPYREGTQVVVHGVVVAGPIFSLTTSLSKFAVADRALSTLQDPKSERHVERLCTCGVAMQVDDLEESDETLSDIEFEDGPERAANGSASKFE